MNALTSDPGKIITLYVVEDYKLVRVGLLSVLRREPSFKVSGESETAEAALEEIVSKKPDIILMDIGLPGMNGIEATEKVKELLPQSKVIILTSHEDENEVLACLSSGANAYCLKDISSDKLVEVIKMVNQGAVWLDPQIAQVALNVFKGGSLVSKNTELKEELTEREFQVLSLIVQGKSNSEIAEEIHVSIHTVKAHVTHVLEKLSVYDRVQAAVKAIKEGIV